MVVTAKVGVVENRGQVRTEAGVFDVRPSDDGGYVVEAPQGEEPGIVRYYSDEQILELQRPGVTAVIAFRPEVEHTTFQFQGHTYEVASMDLGTIDIAESGRQVIRGTLTLSGVRLAFVSPELLPIVRELAFGLALRRAWLEE